MNVSFKEKVTKFWDLFTVKESEVRKMIDDKVETDTLIKYVDGLLSVAFSKAFFELGVNEDGKHELILTPEGDRSRLFQLEYWLKQAPEVLLKKWNFYSTKPAKAKGDFTINMYDTSLSADSIVLYYNVDEKHQKVNLQVQCPQLMKLEENKRYSIFFIYLDQLIGEAYTMEYIGSIDFVVSSTKDFQKIAAADLKKLMDDTIVAQNWFRIENICERCAGYEMVPSKAKDWQLREDIYIAYSSCFPVLNAFYNKSTELFGNFYADGIVFGFLFYENINVPKDRMVPFRTEIEDQILKQAKAERVAESIGGATGFYFSYMDFIIYDLDAFLAIAKDVLAKYKFKEAGFSNFIFGDTPMFFKG
ncbi:hypothetical protein CLV62_11280 [Dysgonomonas alginatilytica]|uniref:Uncharacterized protein n=1 Tax=Dysgonomonas alginatilytica TaxID=1605892 RepID=A0A2V3PQG7_9BACT|nr:hypothetical protein [Dysgonomonas alginatilytica]PXV63831.1 hypothetical protein CLV62_11280 [Dysgonomonas alginatilytica]